MILTGTNEQRDRPQTGDQPHVGNQTGTTLLDKFTHSLIVKCYYDALNTLLNTLITEMKSSDPEHAKLATLVARRFVRSVIRIFVIFNIELAPISKKRRHCISLAAFDTK